MDFVRDYWPQLVALFMLINVLTVMKVDIDVLKEKIKVLFELWNNKDKQ
tara:strand:- start:2797 stop:2943 length:147 start_codon:yes stop_codon:yes gene_type:complete